MMCQKKLAVLCKRLKRSSCDFISKLFPDDIDDDKQVIITCLWLWIGHVLLPTMKAVIGCGIRSTKMVPSGFSQVDCLSLFAEHSDLLNNLVYLMDLIINRYVLDLRSVSQSLSR